MPRLFRALPVVVLLVLASPAASATDVRVLNALIDGVFAAHVDDGYVNYPEISRSVRFHKYLDAIAEFDTDSLADDKERLTFWINAYNALAIKQIIDGLTPVGTLARLKFFRTTEHRVGGRSLDLHSIEDDILQELGDPRVHFAICNTAYSAPKLRSEAYRVDELDQQLEDNTRDFINDVRKNRFSNGLRRAKLSKIFDWYADDFGGSDEAVMAFIAPYMDDEETARNLEKGSFDVRYLEYEWGINGRPM